MSNEYYIFDESMNNSNACKLQTEDFIQNNYSKSKSLQKFTDIQDCVDAFNKSAILYINYMKITVKNNNQSKYECSPVAMSQPANEIKNNNIFSSKNACANSVDDDKKKIIKINNEFLERDCTKYPI